MNLSCDTCYFFDTCDSGVICEYYYPIVDVDISNDEELITEIKRNEFYKEWLSLLSNWDYKYSKNNPDNFIDF